MAFVFDNKYKGSKVKIVRWDHIEKGDFESKKNHDQNEKEIYETGENI